MIGFVIFCIQIFLVQHAFSQTITAPVAINNGLPPNFGPNIAGIGPSQISSTNIAGLSGPMLAGAASLVNAAGQILPGSIAGPMLAGAVGQMKAGPMLGNPGAMLPGAAGPGFPPGSAGPYGPVYGGSGTGDVAVAGELPVAGSTMITGQVPMTGKVQFNGNVPAGGVVTISGQCGCGCNAPYNAPYAAKNTFNNNPYLY